MMVNGVLTNQCHFALNCKVGKKFFKSKLIDDILPQLLWTSTRGIVNVFAAFLTFSKSLSCACEITIILQNVLGLPISISVW